MKARKKHLKRVLAGLLTGVMLANTAASELPALTVNAAAGTNLVAGEISVNPQLHYQTLRGWGSSLCWWGNSIGSWGDQDFNGNGVPDREEIAELAFSPEYLNLNIVRYNVGGGDKEDTTIKRCEGLVPGWTVDMTGTADGTGTFDADTFYNKKTEEMNDAGQLWMLEQANYWRTKTAEENGTENDIINEVFSNSPPYYMTKSGSSTGGNNAESNLKEECYDDFALYMARAAKWIDNDLSAKYGTGVDYIEPMNEPDTNYWSNGSTKQEGCTFDPGTEQSNMLLAMQKALGAEEFAGSLSDIEITGTDETALANAINSFEKLSSDAKNSMTTIGAHTYSGSNSERHTLRKLAQSYDKELWMSEITKGGGTHNHDSMTETQTQSQSEGIMNDLKYMQPSAWVAWLVADSEYECLKFDENWGLIHCVFESDGPVSDYHTNLVYSNGTAKKDVPGEGYWAITKQFYTMMQYSKYLKSGYTMIEIGDENMCAAMSPDGTELVIVAQNFSEERSTTVDLTAFTDRGNAKVYRTSDAENCELVETQDVADGILDVILPKNSVSTFVIEASTDMESYVQLVEADVVTPTDADVSDVDKFTYQGTWSGQTTTQEGASATFTFQGTQAVLLGTKSTTGGKVQVSVDNQAAVEVDLQAEIEMPESILCNTGKLAEGKHTITVTLAEGQTTAGASLTLSHAQIVHGEVSMAGGTTIRKIISHDGGLMVVFDEVSGSGSYTVKYGTSEESLDQSVTVSSNTAVINGLTNGTSYYIQVEDTLGGISNVAVGVPEAPEGNILYFVDTGTSSLYTPASDEQFGLYNSVLDQAYGEDAVSGKSWGYIGDTAAYYQTDGRWQSVRECSSGMEYQFDLPAGSYNVTVAMKDPWTNSGRYTDLVINGETKASGLVPGTGISRTYKTTLSEDGTLSVKAVKSSNNSSNNPMISFIIISAYNAEENVISEIPTQDTVYTVSGVIPQLPTTIRAETVDGTTVEKAVTWETVTADEFTGSNLSTVTVSGTVDGTDFTVSQPVQIVPANTQYFIDCNWAESTQYASLNAVAGLKNEVADKAYTNGSWGYLNSAGGYNGSDSDTYGWYDPVGDKMQYKIPMTAGNYSVTFGFYDWWYYQVRPVYLRAYFGDSAKADEDWGVYEISSKKAEKTTALTLENDTEVTLSVERGSGDAPVLSWIMIQNKLEQDNLKSMLNQAGSLTRAEYTAESLAALDAAVTQGMEQLLKSDAAQESVDAAAADIQKALSGLSASTADKAGLQALVDKANGIDITAYTTDTAEALSIALTTAEDLLKQANISKTELETAKANLQAAINNLTAKPEEKEPAEIREELGALILKAKTLTSTLYTEASWSALQTAVSQAETVYADQKAEAAALTSARNDLQLSIQSLESSSQDVGGDSSGKQEIGNYNVVLTKEKLKANDYVLYTANCGTPDPSVVPGGEKMGLLQSNVDQTYGADPVTGAVWGCAPADANSAAVKGGSDADDTGESYVYMSENVTFDKEKSGLLYSFEVPSSADSFEGVLKNTYEVTVSFKNPWSSRNVNISLEGEDVESGLVLTQNKWITKTYQTVVTDGELNVFVHNPDRTDQYEDPILNFISVKAVEGEPDTAALEKAVEAAAGLLEKDYTADSWKGLKEAYITAQALVENPGNDQSVIDKQAAALNEAVKALVTLESILEQAIKDYTVADSDKALYTEASWNTYQAALKAVTDMKTAGGYTESSVNQAIAALKTAFEGLTKAATDPTETTKPVVVKVSKITVSGTISKLAKGKTVTLSAAVAPSNAANKTLKWTSSNQKVATVNAKGVVTGKGKGTATITATAADGSGVKGTYKITVVNNAVKKITLNAGTKAIASGKKVTVAATIKTTGTNANKTLSWSSSNTKYATVNAKGVVTAKKAGIGKTVTITAKATDGSGKKATVKIKIVKHAVKKITLKCSSKTVKAGKKVTVKATVKTTGKTANKTLSWTTSNKKYATVNAKGVVTAKKAGKGKTVTITAKAVDGSGKKASVKIKIK